MGENRFIPTNLNYYKVGDEVFAKEAPDLPLIVRRYVHSIYYCKRKNAPDLKELVYFERELIIAPKD